MSAFEKQILLRLSLIVALALSSSCALITTARAQPHDAVLLNPTETPIRIGYDTPFARFNERLILRRSKCARAMAVSLSRVNTERVTIGPALRELIVETAACLPADQLPPESAARGGAITAALWRAIAPDLRPPTLAERIDALTLSFEATDFTDPPEWNFCQDSPGPSNARPAAIVAGGACHNVSDPCSMLTWGPRGATAGQGGEIQWILWSLHRQSPTLLANAFGEETRNVVRFVQLKRPLPTSCDGSSPVEHFMCSVWTSAKRRRAWEKALMSLGRSQTVRRAYQQLYSGLEFDGYKMNAYFDLWREVGAKVSEVDLAFFFDRATHIGGPPEQSSGERAGFEACVKAEAARTPLNAVARRCLALSHPHQFQPVDRLGRDVAYYRAAYGNAGMTEREVQTWSRHIPLDAVANFGLSDDRNIDPESVRATAVPEADRPPETLTILTASEAACSPRIRNPIRSKPQ